MRCCLTMPGLTARRRSRQASQIARLQSQLRKSRPPGPAFCCAQNPDPVYAENELDKPGDCIMAASTAGVAARVTRAQRRRHHCRHQGGGIEYVLSVPDIATSSGLLAPIAHDKELRLIRVCKEDECIGIASGLSYCDKRALILIQHTGFLDSINAIRGIAVEYKQPICMMVGLLAARAGSRAARLVALRRAHRRADPRRHGHRPSSHRRRRRRGKNPAGDRARPMPNRRRSHS